MHGAGAALQPRPQSLALGAARLRPDVRRNLGLVRVQLLGVAVRAVHNDARNHLQPPERRVVVSDGVPRLAAVHAGQTRGGQGGAVTSALPSTPAAASTDAAS